MINPSTESGTSKPSAQPQWLAGSLLVYGLLVATFFVARYVGMWAEGDSARISQSIQAVQDAASLTPTGAYQHGYGYQVVSVALLSATGLSLEVLQGLVFPLLAAGALALTAWAAYAQTTGHPGTGLLAALLLLLQPDVLFVVLRGSHEKLGWPLMMLALLLLHRSLGQAARHTAMYAILFYATVFALIAVNVFFASVFLSAVTCGLVLGLMLGRRRGRHAGLLPSHLQRLAYVSASGSVLVFLFIIYLYSPAGANLRLLNGVLEQLSVLLLSFELQSRPYDYIAFGWVSPHAYLGLTAFTWLLIGASLIAWLRRGRRLLGRPEELNLRTDLDWLLYAGFACQVAVSIVVDLAGVIVGNNLQLRVFPGFTVLAVALLARALVELLARPGCRTGPVRVLTGLAVGCFAVAAVLKASNDPALSNKWSFYSYQEMAALEWTDAHLRHGSIWTAFDERLAAAFDFARTSRADTGNRFAGYSLKPEQNHVLVSEIERLRGQRLGQPMPAVLAWNRVYDNGQVALYHRRPLTPYQR